MVRITRTTNPTDLKTLEAKLFSVRVQMNGDGVRSFWLERFDFASSGLPHGLLLSCVAHAGSTEEFFNLGAIDAPANSTHELHELATDRPLKFRFLVHESDSPKLIAFADNIRPVDESGVLGNSLVDIQPADLGGAAWKLEIPEITAGADKPVLLVERQLFPTAQAAAKDMWIVTLVMPEVMRQIARRISESPSSLEDNETWVSGWAEFFTAFGIGEIPDDNDVEGKESWVEEVVAAFCAKPAIKYQINRAITELIGEK